MNRAWITAAALAALAVVVGCGPATAAPGQVAGEDTATVERVVDGDTVKLDDGRTVRTLGLDTPETRHPSRPVECWGPEATAYAETVLAGQQVAVRPDPTQDEVDRYGRTLAYLILPDGRNYSIEAAKAGAGRAYVYDDRPVFLYPRILLAEAEARASARGLWGCPR